ncbi:DNA/RNA non-specific endonuclease [Streptomyces sp. NPDC005227]|uniref:DNA/RNA non-specific endonuclease n=1 Tax=Streptomyces sp. NPDC005227 TaxID=3364707 RepID=UPI0036BC417B
MGAMSVACIKTVNDIVTQPTAPRARDAVAQAMLKNPQSEKPFLETGSAALDFSAATLSAIEQAASVLEVHDKLADVVRALATARQQGAPSSVTSTLQKQLTILRRAADRRTVELSQARREAGLPPTPLSPIRTGDGTCTDAVRASLPVTIHPELVITRTEALNLDVPIRPNDLSPNTAYTYGEHVYVTDDQGKPAYMRGVGTYTANPPRHTTLQQGVSRSGQAAEPDRFGDLVGGHALAAALGGFPSGPNLFPQNGNMNISAFATLEKELRSLAKQGVHVEYEIQMAVDDPGDVVPSALLVTYYVEGVEFDQITLLNEAHQLK